jgi:hypothetical protein
MERVGTATARNVLGVGGRVQGGLSTGSPHTPDQVIRNIMELL